MEFPAKVNAETLQEHWNSSLGIRELATVWIRHHPRLGTTKLGIRGKDHSSRTVIVTEIPIGAAWTIQQAICDVLRNNGYKNPNHNNPWTFNDPTGELVPLLRSCVIDVLLRFSPIHHSDMWNYRDVVTKGAEELFTRQLLKAA